MKTLQSYINEKLISSKNKFEKVKSEFLVYSYDSDENRKSYIERNNVKDDDDIYEFEEFEMNLQNIKNPLCFEIKKEIDSKNVADIIQLIIDEKDYLWDFLKILNIEILLDDDFIANPFNQMDMELRKSLNIRINKANIYFINDHLEFIPNNKKTKWIIFNSDDKLMTFIYQLLKNGGKEESYLQPLKKEIFDSPDKIVIPIKWETY